MNIATTPISPENSQALYGDPAYPAPSDIAHVSIFSGTNYEQMLSFYQAVLNMRVVYRIENSRITFTALSFDDENHRIGLVKLGGLDQRAPNTVRIEHTSWRYKSLTDLLAAVRHIEQATSMFPSAIHQGKMIALSYMDPDGNRCEVFCECMANQADIIDFYVNKLDQMPEFNTLLPFDLRGMLRLQDAGEDLDHFYDYDWVKEHLPAQTAEAKVDADVLAAQGTTDQ